MLSSSSTADTPYSETDFNTAFQTAVTGSNLVILKRTCSLGTYCKIPEMIYKRKVPAVSFSPYSCLLTAWVEGTDNVHGTDFELYSSLAFSDSIEDSNKFTYCNFGSNFKAFGNCGPTAAVLNNAIGAYGTSTL